jgi:TP901 family phage tail tape measure protein
MAVSNVELRVDSRQAVNALRDLNRASGVAEAGLRSLKNAATGLLAGLAFSQLIKSASQFEAELSEIGKTAGSSEKEIASLAVALKNLSAPSKTNLAPSILAAGVKDLVAQGLKLNDAIASMETLGKVAVATNSELTDVTKTGFQLQSALKIRPTELKATFDALAFAGKAGAFELKDMAQFMPTIASAATSLGIQGKDGAVALAAMMQMVRKDAPGAAEASTRLTDALLKMTAPETVKNFTKFGVDIEGVLKKAVKDGVNPMDAAIKELIRVTGKDPFKLSQIFGDKEAKLALVSLMKYKEEYEKLKAAAGGAAAAGTVQADFEKSLKTFNGQLQTLQASGELVALSLGAKLLPILARLIKEILPIVNGVASFAEGMGEIPKPVIDAAIGIGKVIIQLMLVDKALKIATATAALFRGAMLLLTTQTTLAGAAALTGQARLLMLASGIQGAGAAAATASPAMLGLLGLLGRLAAIGAIAVVVNLAVTGMAAIFQAQAEINKLRGIRAAGGPKSFGGSASAEQKQTQRSVLAAIQKERESSEFRIQQAGAAFGVGRIMGRQRADVLTEREASARAILALPARAIPAGSGGGGGDAGVGGGPVGTRDKSSDKAAKEAERAAEAAAKEAERVTQVIKDRLAEGQLTRIKSELQDKITAAETSGDKMLALRLQSKQKEIDLQYRYAQELAKEKDIRAQEAIIFAGQSELVANERDLQRDLAELQRQAAKDQITALEALIGKQYELTEQQKQQKTLAEGITNTVGQGMTSAFDALIQGSEDFSTSLRKIASGVLIDIANQLLQVFVIQKAISAIGGLLGGGITGGGGFSYSGVTGSALGTSMLSGNFTATPFSTVGLGLRANGGSVTAGKPYMVGERGPELFMPGRSGGIAPANSFGGGVNVVVNVDATGSSVQGDQSQAKQLGGVISAAVQSELIKQKRPGGLLA